MVHTTDEQNVGQNLEKSIELNNGDLEKTEKITLEKIENEEVLKGLPPPPPPSSLMIDNSPGQSESSPECVQGKGPAMLCECDAPITEQSTGHMTSLNQSQGRCQVFMKSYVDLIFDPESKLSPLGDIKDEFNKLCQITCGRKQFALYVTAKRATGMVVCEKVFYRLVANFMTILHLCNIEDDIGSAKVLMILTFTFQYDGTFLYEELLYHPIWKSLRFWNAAFFHAVHTERKMRVRSNNTFSKQSDAEKEECKEVHKNIYFGQLSSFLSNMQAFGLSNKDICDFRDKLFEIGDLEQEQMDMLCTLTDTLPLKTTDAPISPMDHVRKFSKTLLKRMESIADAL